MYVQFSFELFGISPEILTQIVLLVSTWWVNARRRP